ncbi:MAG: RAD55 family ATPase [Candidatus Hydrothermarchaeota archaeon]
MKDEEYSIGLEGIDVKIKPECMIMVLGDAYSGHKLFCHQCCGSSLKNNEGVIYISTNDTAKKVVEEISRFSSSLENLRIVDCYSLTFDENCPRDIENVSCVSGPLDLGMILASTSNHIEDLWRKSGIKRIRVVLDSVSTLLMYSSIKPVFRFLHVFTGRIKAVGGICFFVMNESIHKPEEVNAIQQLMQGLMHFKGEELLLKGFVNDKFRYRIETSMIKVI